MSGHVTQHAIERAIERIAGITTEEQARAVLTSAAVQIAISFGAAFVRLGTGQRIAIRDGAVITVLPAENYRKQVRRFGLGRFG